MFPLSLSAGEAEFYASAIKRRAFEKLSTTEEKKKMVSWNFVFPLHYFMRFSSIRKSSPKGAIRPKRHHARENTIRTRLVVC